MDIIARMITITIMVVSVGIRVGIWGNTKDMRQWKVLTRGYLGFREIIALNLLKKYINVILRAKSKLNAGKIL